MSVDVSVVIVTYNSRRHIDALLTSLAEHTRGVEYEVILVDNAASDGTAAHVREAFSAVRVIARTTNIGLSGGINDGVRASAGRYVAVLNPDIRFEHDALSVLAAFLREHADTGVVAPKLLNDDGSVQMSCRAFPGYAAALFNRYSLLTRLLPGNRYSRDYLMTGFDHATVRDVDWVSGAALMFPRAVFDELGGWDAGYFMFNEDVDFCRRVHDAGYRVVYEPAAVLYHRIGVSVSAPPRMIVARHRSMWRYYRKHLRGNIAVDAVTALGITARCGVMLVNNAVRRRRR